MSPSNMNKNNIFCNYPDVVDLKQFQEMVGVSKKTAYRILRSGEIECRKVGREYRIPKINVIRYIG